MESSTLRPSRTPTQTYRSGKSGVHRFNPRTFEVDFHYPIGPNPHGHVFDRWGFEFANDGTSGTGGYVGIGKGLRPANKQWFKKEWRPVAATGLLSSSHFPDELQNNFLICNTIGFLGVLQYEVKYNGAEITAVRTDDIVRSDDPNFRPSDIEVGGDGALYVADWHNALIGHMQHNMRDPNRDDEHGRVYRISAIDRQPLRPVKMRGKPIEEVLQNFFAKDNGIRYRARLELSGREREDVVRSILEFTSDLDATRDQVDRDEAQALLECLWVMEEQRVPSINLVKKAFLAREPRVRSGAIRSLGHWAGRVDGWENTLLEAAKDESPLVRAEAVKSAAEFQGPVAAEAFYEVANRPTDPELVDVLAYASQRIDIPTMLAKAFSESRDFSPAMREYALSHAKIDDVKKLGRSEDVYRAILNRPEATSQELAQAFDGYLALSKANKMDLLMSLIENTRSQGGNVEGLGKILAKQSPEELGSVRDQIEDFAVNGETLALKQVGYSAWVSAAGPGDAFLAATQSRSSLQDFLTAVPGIAPQARRALYDKIEPLIFEVPVHLQSSSTEAVDSQQGMIVEYFESSPDDLKNETLDKLQPVATDIVADVSKDIAIREKDEWYALRFTAWIQVPVAGEYAFRVESDDGSRVYVDDQLVVDNDGPHGMAGKRSKPIQLSAGPHKYVVSYTNRSGASGLSSGWRGPGFKWQKVPAELMKTRGSTSIQDYAIRALESIPGKETQKIAALSRLIANGRNRAAAISALSGIDAQKWPKKAISPLLDNLVGYLTAMPAKYRTGTAATTAVELARSLSGRLPAADAQALSKRLENLDVRVIAIGTVPTRMIYDKERIVAQAGKPVEFRFSNTDAMPHNFAVVMPGSLNEVGELAEATGRDKDAADRNYIPDSDKILVSSKLLQPGDNQSIAFDVPEKPGVYPYVCTYPGHYRRMYGALYVVENLEDYQADPEAYLASQDLAIQDELLQQNTRGQQWAYDDLIVDMQPEIPMGRSYEVGKELFKVASCSGCHQLNGEGRVFGPNLAELDAKKHNVQYILRSLLEPSKDIEEKYRSYTFELESGKSITGMVTEEDQSVVKVVIDPLAKDAATVIPREEIEERIQSEVSMMPAGLLDKLSREEILDLVAYVFAKGDKSSKLFEDCHHH